MTSPWRAWRPAAAAAAVVTALAAAFLAGCGGRAPGNPSGGTPRPTAERTERTAAVAAGRSSAPQSSPMPSPAHPVTPPPAGRTAPPGPTALAVAPGAGHLPQTEAFPSANSLSFRHAMTDLWLAVTTGRPALGMPGFFPAAAYERLKAVYDPGGDWRNRLWYDFTLDVAAAHSLVGRRARFVRAIVPSSEAAWISPGVCENSVGYWHVGGVRVVYRKDGALRSFGIASLISWRGEWYVIHFGAVLRGEAAGIVDQPEAGEGFPGPAGGC